jgi:hypothetical protein
LASSFIGALQAFLTNRTARRTLIIFAEESVTAFHTGCTIRGASLTVGNLLTAGNTYIILEEVAFNAGVAFFST